jgi:SAM-dependent methyltransferase
MLSHEVGTVSHGIFGGLSHCELPRFAVDYDADILDTQMANLWSTPVYQLTARTGKRITVDVTTSVSAGLPPNKLLHDTIVPFFKSNGVERILDFGAGSLRHTFPLLEAGFQVCAVEFEQQFTKPVCAEAMRRAERHHNFCRLIWPHDFIRDNRRFDAALLCYVLQTMPLVEERNRVLRLLRNKLRDESYLFWMSRFGQTEGIPQAQKVKDGYFMWPDREAHSFYTEFRTEDTHEMFGAYGFRKLRSLSERGTDQAFLYGKGKSTWI